MWLHGLVVSCTVAKVSSGSSAESLMISSSALRRSLLSLHSRIRHLACLGIRSLGSRVWGPGLGFALAAASS